MLVAVCVPVLGAQGAAYGTWYPCTWAAHVQLQGMPVGCLHLLVALWVMVPTHGQQYGMHGGCLQAHKRGMLAWSALVGVVDR